MQHPQDCILYSGGAAGTENWFGRVAEEYGIEEVNYSFGGHQIDRARGARVLTSEELALKGVSLTYISKIMSRQYTPRASFPQGAAKHLLAGEQRAGSVRRGHDSARQYCPRAVPAWGRIHQDLQQTPVGVRPKNAWFSWDQDVWSPDAEPVINSRRFIATGTRFLEVNGKAAIGALFARSFKK